MRVRALKYYYVDRQEHHAGEEFEMDDRQEAAVDILCKLGTLERVGGEKKLDEVDMKARSAEAWAFKAEDDEKARTGEIDLDLASPNKPEGRRIYRRRDLRAEK